MFTAEKENYISMKNNTYYNFFEEKLRCIKQKKKQIKISDVF